MDESATESNRITTKFYIKIISVKHSDGLL